MKRILIPALATVSLAACLDSESTGVERTPCDPLLLEVTDVAGDTVSESSGLQYIERQAGSGAAVEAGQRARVHYTLSLPNEQILESSCVRARTLEFDLGAGGVIEGFDLGVTGMQVGGVRRLILPPSLAYGDDPTHQLRNETLVFDIELVEILPPAEPGT